MLSRTWNQKHTPHTTSQLAQKTWAFARADMRQHVPTQMRADWLAVQVGPQRVNTTRTTRTQRSCASPPVAYSNEVSPPREGGQRARPHPTQPPQACPPRRAGAPRGRASGTSARRAPAHATHKRTACSRGRRIERALRRPIETTRRATRCASLRIARHSASSPLRRGNASDDDVHFRISQAQAPARRQHILYRQIANPWETRQEMKLITFGGKRKRW